RAARRHSSSTPIIRPSPLTGRQLRSPAQDPVRNPHGVMRPIRSVAGSVSQRLPSGPVVIPKSMTKGHGERELGDSSAGRTTPNLAKPCEPEVAVGAARDPFRLVVRSGERKLADGSAKVMRPIWLAPYSVNQRAPSGPLVISAG